MRRRRSRCLSCALLIERLATDHPPQFWEWMTILRYERGGDTADRYSKGISISWKLLKGYYLLFVARI